MNRSKRSAINIVAVLFNSMVKAIIPFILRTLVIYRLGEKYTGLGGLFTSILTVLNLTELGFGNAIGFLMYKPMADLQYERVSKLLNYMKRVFLFVGCIVSLLGMLVCPFLNHLINGTVPEDVNIYTLYVLYLLNTVASYFFGGYNRTVIQAGQRNDVISNIDSIVYMITSIIQIVVLVFFPNYYLYIIWLVLSSVVSNIIISQAEKKMFPKIRPRGLLDKSEKRIIYGKVKALFLYRIGNIIFTSSDNIVISAFLGLEIIAYYGNYYQMINIIFALTYTAFGAITSVIANKINQTSTKESKFLFNTINFWVCNLSGVFFVGFVLLAQSFMIIWMGEGRLIENSTVILLGVSFYIQQTRRGATVWYDALGLWDQSSFAPFISGIVNLILNIILVQKIGLNGVVLSTIIASLIIGVPWEIFVIFNQYYHENSRKYLFENLVYVAAIIVNTAICKLVIVQISLFGIVGLILKGIVIILIMELFS